MLGYLGRWLWGRTDGNREGIISKNTPGGSAWLRPGMSLLVFCEKDILGNYRKLVKIPTNQTILIFFSSVRGWEGEFPLLNLLLFSQQLVFPLPHRRSLQGEPSSLPSSPATGRQSQVGLFCVQGEAVVGLCWGPQSACAIFLRADRQRRWRYSSKLGNEMQNRC